MRIAVLEDDLLQAQHMEVWLEAAGHSSQHYATGRGLLDVLKRETFDLLILDWMLPDIPGDEVLSWVRNNLDWHIPVIFVTVRDSEKDIVYALERGADDYMIKPIKPLEMLARITALGRRSKLQAETAGVLELGRYRLDRATRTVTVDGEPVDLTQKEFDLALFLFSHVGRLISRKHIMEVVWGQRADLNTRTVDTHVSRIRNKLELTPEHGWRLSAVYQHGYRLERLDQEEAAIGAAEG